MDQAIESTKAMDVQFRANLPIAAYQVNLSRLSRLTPPQPYSYHSFLLVSQGDMTVHVNNHIYLADVGDLFFIQGGSVVGVTDASRIASYQVVTFDLRALIGEDAHALSYCDRLDDHTWHIDTYLGRNAIVQREMFDRLYSITGAGTRDGFELEARGIVLQMIGRLLQEGRCHANSATDRDDVKAQHSIRQVFTLIEEHYAQDISLADMAASVNLSPNYFCRYFKKITGCSPVDYLIDYRLGVAAHMLINTEESIADIALACGFHDSSHFIKFFRRKKLVTPRRYRQLHGCQIEPND